MTFDDFDFDYDLLDGLDVMGFNEPTPIQAQAIPVILANKDLIACAQTGYRQNGSVSFADFE
ncbi:MAG: hypothetical protein R2822_25680 [Spirosomataceae bacterium]